MAKRVVVVSGRSPEGVDEILGCLEDVQDVALRRTLLVNGHHNPMHGLESTPDVLILSLTSNSKLELEALAQLQSDQRAALILVGDTTEPDLLRLAMQAGGRDFLSRPLNGIDLRTALHRTLKEKEVSGTGTGSNRTTTFINAKGGSGSSFIAANYAHLSKHTFGKSTLLMDLDRQFAALPQYLDLQPKASLFDALYVVDELDVPSVDAFIARHKSGLAVMASSLSERVADDAEPNHEIDEAQALLQLTHILEQKYDRIVTEVPRYIDTMGATVLQQSDQIMMILQQSVPGVRDAARLKSMLVAELGVAPDRIAAIVNRYSSNSETGLDDIRDALALKDVYTLPNDYQSASAAIDMGVPLIDVAPKSPVVSALNKIIVDIEGIEQVKSDGLLARSLSALLRR